MPLLQRHLAPIWAAIILGLIWGAWHYPAFLLSGTPQSAWSFTPFLIGSVCLSVLVTPMFNASRGSILLAALHHFQLNNPLWPDAQPYDTIFFVVAAVAVVAFNREALFSKTAAITTVIPERAT
jgi:membrane protease YdiL (CAAX protease family)